MPCSTTQHHPQLCDGRVARTTVLTRDEENNQRRATLERARRVGQDRLTRCACRRSEAVVGIIAPGRRAPARCRALLLSPGVMMPRSPICLVALGTRGRQRRMRRRATHCDLVRTPLALDAVGSILSYGRRKLSCGASAIRPQPFEIEAPDVHTVETRCRAWQIEDSPGAIRRSSVVFDRIRCARPPRATPGIVRPGNTVTETSRHVRAQPPRIGEQVSRRELDLAATRVRRGPLQDTELCRSPAWTSWRISCDATQGTLIAALETRLITAAERETPGQLEHRQLTVNATQAVRKA